MARKILGDVTVTYPVGDLVVADDQLDARTSNA
jgi:hypothetical protein